MRKAGIPYLRSMIVLGGIVTGAVMFARCVQSPGDQPEKPAGTEAFRAFAGSVSCEQCHSSMSHTFEHTAHHNTSLKAEEHRVDGSFDSGKNVFAFTSTDFIRMEKRESHLYQVEYDQGVEKHARRFDYIFGSGKKGQTYLNWADNTLLQLPVSWFSATGSWSNSPGYPLVKAVFSRPVTVRCLECHMTYAEDITQSGDKQESFDETQMIAGVECEKCHGPGAAHVNFQQSHPKDSVARYILNPSHLTRQQNLDLCRSCHGGRLNKTQPSFRFTAGNKLTDFYNLDSATADPTNIDVHGNQYGLLAASACFKSSDITCNSCHNNHEDESGKLAIFSARCQTCHSAAGHEKICPKAAGGNAAIVKNCIDCHMPVQPSKAIMVFLQGDTKPTPATMRSHFIRVYPEASKKFLEKIKRG